MDNTILVQKKRIDAELQKIIIGSTDQNSTTKQVITYNVFPGGKRLRALMTLFIYKALEGKNGDIISCSCAPELIHIATLMLDDLPGMDNSDYRRNKLVSHKKFGEANTILSAFGLATEAFNILSNKVNLQGLAPQKALTMIQKISYKIGFYGLIGGQIADLNAGKDLYNCSNDKEKLHDITYNKTAALFEVCAIISTHLAEASEQEQESFMAYAQNFGIALQIFDDLQDIHEDKLLSYPKIYGVKESEKLLREKINAACEQIQPKNNASMLLKKLPQLLLELKKL